MRILPSDKLVYGPLTLQSKVKLSGPSALGSLYTIEFFKQSLKIASLEAMIKVAAYESDKRKYKIGEKESLMGNSDA